MRARNQTAAGAVSVASAAMLFATLLLVGIAAGQGRGDRENPARQQDEGTRSAPAPREGGIPRKELGPERDRDREDGFEEGLPESQARTKEIQPRWVPPRGDGKLGVWARNTDSGVVITRVARGSAAERIGLERGDRIVSVGGYQVGYVGDLLYPLGFELRRHADSRGDVLLLVQNVRNHELMNLTARLDRDRPLPRERE